MDILDILTLVITQATKSITKNGIDGISNKIQKKYEVLSNASQSMNDAKSDVDKSDLLDVDQKNIKEYSNYEIRAINEVRNILNVFDDIDFQNQDEIINIKSIIDEIVDSQNSLIKDHLDKYRNVIEKELQEMRNKLSKRNQVSSSRLHSFGMRAMAEQDGIPNTKIVISSCVISFRKFDERYKTCIRSPSKQQKSELVKIYCTVRWKVFLLFVCIEYISEKIMDIDELAERYVESFKKNHYNVYNPALIEKTFVQIGKNSENQNIEYVSDLNQSILMQMFACIVECGGNVVDIVNEEVRRHSKPMARERAQRIAATSPTYLISIYFRDEPRSYLEILSKIVNKNFDIISSNSETLIPGDVAKSDLEIRIIDQSGGFIDELVRKIHSDPALNDILIHIESKKL